MDVDMVSPPVSPRASSVTNDDVRPTTLPRSSPVPIMDVKSQNASSHLQTPINKPSSPPFYPAAAFTQPIFKPKTLQGHNTRSATPSSTGNLLNASTRAARNKQLQSATSSIDPDSTVLQSRLLASDSNKKSLDHTQPLQIPQPGAKIPIPSSDLVHLVGRSATASNPHTAALLHPNSSALPQSLPNLSPSFPATLFGGLSTDDEHVTVWEPSTGKTVAGNAAPYRRNLAAWLEAHPGWEEKADELKSSKRRSAARRARAAADAFAAMCCYPVATLLTNEAARYLSAMGDGDHCAETAMMMWSNDDFVRLQEAIFRLAKEMHAQELEQVEVDESKWAQVSAHVGGTKMQGTVVYCAHHMLTRGITKSQREMVANGVMPRSFSETNRNHSEDFSAIGSSGLLSLHKNGSTRFLDTVGPRSLPTFQTGLGTSFLDRSFRAPREPRVTVWNPSNGRTISGNAAPCRRNLEAWMRQHPGWYPKEEGQLSSSRRNRNRSNGRIGSSSSPAAADIVSSMEELESPHFHDALEGLLCLSRSPSVGISPSNSLTVDAELEEQVARVEAEIRNRGTMLRVGSVQVKEGDEKDSKKRGITSSISCSSTEDGEVSDVDVMETSKMEL